MQQGLAGVPSGVESVWVVVPGAVHTQVWPGDEQSPTEQWWVLAHLQMYPTPLEPWTQMPYFVESH